MDHAVPLRERGVEVRMEFGGTEIAVSCYKQHDGDKLLDAKVCFVYLLLDTEYFLFRFFSSTWYFLLRQVVVYTHIHIYIIHPH